MISRRRTMLGTFLASATLFALAAAPAWAYTVTVHVHGAGTVGEVTNRFATNWLSWSCTAGPSGKANTSVQDCVGGSPTGQYNFGNVVRLGQSVSSTASARGWHFDHWTDGTAAGQINCDPQETTGDFSSPDYCEFQVFQDLSVDLYFSDGQAPNTTLGALGPTGPTNQTHAEFSWDSDDPDATFQCKLDRPGVTGSYASCGSPSGQTVGYSGLTANGSYTFSVRGLDPSGNVETTPSTRTWTVDTTPPTLALGGGPAQGSSTNQTGATFTIGTSEGSISCRLDGVAAPCTPPTKALSGLGDGSHTFAISASDPLGNTATTSRTWTVDTVRPTLTLSGGPAQNSSTSQTGATFTIGTSESAVSCTLDGVAIACAPPTKMLSGIADGPHTFAVSATDAAGNTSSASRTWTVDTVPPTLTLTGGPPEGSLTDQTSATFTIASSEGTLSCAVDGLDVPCAPPTATVSGLGDGVHVFAITASDAVGNAASASRTWAVKVPAAGGGGTLGAGPGSAPPRRSCKKGRRLKHGKCVKKRGRR